MTSSQPAQQTAAPSTSSVYTRDLMSREIVQLGFEVGDYSIGVPLVHWWGEKAKLKIGKFCSFGGNVRIYLGGNARSDRVTSYPFMAEPIVQLWPEAKSIDGYPATKGDVVIGHDVWLGNDCAIMSGVTIGHGSIIGTRSVVTKDVPPYTVVAGNPATVVRTRFADHQIEQLLKLSWWDWPVHKIKKHIHLLASSQIERLVEQAAADV